MRIIDDATWSAVQARIAVMGKLFPAKGLMRGRNAALHSKHLFSGFLTCGRCGGAITIVSGGAGSPRYGCQRAHKQGAAACVNRLTIRAKIADTALLAGLQTYLSTPDTIGYLADALSTRLNALIDERPRLRALKVAERDTLRQKLTHLIAAIEEGGGSAGLASAMRAREAELARLEADLAQLAEPIADRLAVIPSWVRQQVADVVGLLTGPSERAKQEFQRLGVGYSVLNVSDEGPRPFWRAVGTTEFSSVLAGCRTDLSTTVSTRQRSEP